MIIRSWRRLQIIRIHRTEIVAHQATLIELLGIDAARAHTTCWACRRSCRPQRAHIVPERFGARPVQPRNYLLLCEGCHRAQPDASPWPVQLAWLMSYRREPLARAA